MLNCSPGLAAFVFSSLACFSVSSVPAAGAAEACLGRRARGCGRAQPRESDELTAGCGRKQSGGQSDEEVTIPKRVHHCPGSLRSGGTRSGGNNHGQFQRPTSTISRTAWPARSGMACISAPANSTTPASAAAVRARRSMRRQHHRGQQAHPSDHRHGVGICRRRRFLSLQGGEGRFFRGGAVVTPFNNAYFNTAGLQARAFSAGGDALGGS